MSAVRPSVALALVYSVFQALPVQMYAQDPTSAAARLEYELDKRRVEEAFRSQLPLPEPRVPKAISGEDNRRDLVSLAVDDFKRKAAHSTCLLTNKSRLAKVGTEYTLALEDYRVSGLACCGGEAFGTQQVGGWCSGFLVASDVVVTAGHCCKNTEQSVQGIAFIFGFAIDAAGNTPSKFPENRVYFGKKIVKHQFDTAGDFAIVQLDRPVTAEGAKPLAVAAEAPGIDTPIVLIGYPSGLPCKTADGAKVMERVAGDTWLRTNCDSYGGNSGSAVISDCATPQVIGILVRGAQDFKIKTVGGANCFESVRYREDEGNEILTRTEVFRTAIPVGP